MLVRVRTEHQEVQGNDVLCVWTRLCNAEHSRSNDTLKIYHLQALLIGHNASLVNSVFQEGVNLALLCGAIQDVANINHVHGWQRPVQPLNCLQVLIKMISIWQQVLVCLKRLHLINKGVKLNGQ